MAQLNFDASTVPPQEALDPLPAGWYPMQIIKSEIKPTSKPGGVMLETTMEIIGGEYNKRKAFDRFNLQNVNPQAVEIAYHSLSAICHAVGVIQVADSEQLHGKPMLVKLSLRGPRTDPATGTSYEASNEVRGYKPLGATSPGAPAGAGLPSWATGQQAVATGGSVSFSPAAAPWAQNAAAPALAATPAKVFPWVAAPPSAVFVFPPEGWTVHPTAPGYYYKGTEAIPEEELRKRFAPPPVINAAPPPPPAPIAPPIPAAPAVPFVDRLAAIATPVPSPAPVAAIAPAPSNTPPWMITAPSPAVNEAPPAPAPVVVSPVPPWAVGSPKS